MKRIWFLMGLASCSVYAGEVSLTAEEKAWLGNYSYSGSGMNATGTRSFVIGYCVEVKPGVNGLIAKKYHSENGDDGYTAQLWDVQLKPKKIIFYYRSCFIPENGKSCSDTTKIGSKMLELTRMNNKGQAFFKPTWFALPAVEKKSSVDVFEKTSAACLENDISLNETIR